MKKTAIIITILALITALVYRTVKKISDPIGLGKIPSRPPKIRIVYSKKQKTNEREKITSSHAAVDVLREVWSSQMEIREEFIVLLMDRSNKVIGYHLLSQGGISGTVADVRLVFAVALKSLASAIIIAHNHPSGNLTASKSDLHLTRKIVEAGSKMDIPVLDHIILTKDSFMSFADEGLI